MCAEIEFVRGGGVALRFPFAEFSQVLAGRPSDRVIDEGHHRSKILVQSTGGPGGTQTHDPQSQSLMLCHLSYRPAGTISFR